LDVLTIEQPEQLAVLKRISEPVSDINKEVGEFSDEMIQAMILGKGIGLAAPQVGRLERFFVIHLQDKESEPLIFINPEIIETSTELSSYEEGCLSIPGSYQKVVRPAFIRIQAWNTKGRPFTMNADGILAVVIQHEFDHLNGRLFIDHLGKRKRDKILKKHQVGDYQ